MGCEWPSCRLEELAAPIDGAIAIGPFGSRLKADSYVSQGVALIRGTNLGRGRSLSGEFVFITPDKAAELGSANLKPSDLVFPHRGAIGEVGLVPDDKRRYALSTSLMKVTLDSKRADAGFYYYFFRSHFGRAELLKNASQVGTPGIARPLTSLRECTVPCPSLCEQGPVAELLGELDGRIENLRATNTTLEAIAQALFKSWFVDFDPVHAKAEGRAPEGLDAATAALFPSEFEDSELGPVPKGWRTAALGDLADLNASRWTKRSHPATVNYLDLSGVTRNRIDLPTEYEFDEAPSRARNHLRHGDTIVGTVRPANRAFAYISQPEDNLTGSTGFAVLSPKQLYLASYVYLAATMDASIDRLANLADGAAYPAVRPSVVAETPCVVPPAAILERFSTLTLPMLGKIAQNSAIAWTLADLRDTLLPRLISGKLRLPQVIEAPLA